MAVKSPFSKDTVMGVYLVFLNTLKLSNNLIGPKTGDLAYIEPKLQNGGFTAFSAGDTVMGVYLVFLNTFKLLNNLMGPKTGALSRPDLKLAIWRVKSPFRQYLTEIGNFF